MPPRLCLFTRKRLLTNVLQAGACRALRYQAGAWKPENIGLPGRSLGTRKHCVTRREPGNQKTLGYQAGAWEPENDWQAVADAVGETHLPAPWQVAPQQSKCGFKFIQLLSRKDCYGTFADSA